MARNAMGNASRWAFVVFAIILAAEVAWLFLFPQRIVPLAAPSSVECPVIDTVALAAEQKLETLRTEDAWAAIDSHALAAPSNVETDVHSLACYLVAPAHDDWEKVRAIFRWIADRIRYDDAAFNSGKYGLPDAQALLDLRRGVCQDYARLFDALAAEAGIPSKIIVGFSKGFSSLQRLNSLEPDHAWNAFQIDGQWHLTDVTWAAGYGEMRGGLLHSTQRFDGYWFAPPPAEFVCMHLPSEGRWQLLDTTLSVADFDCLPTVTADYFEIGYAAAPLLAAMRDGRSTEVARVYAHTYDVHVVAAPAQRHITRDSLQLQYVCHDCAAMSVQTGGRLIDFERSDSLFCIDVKPRKGTLRVFARRQKHARRYDGVMEFWVGE